VHCETVDRYRITERPQKATTMEGDTSTPHTDQASPRDEEQCIATLSINSSSIPRSFPPGLPRNFNPSTPRAFEDVPRWQNLPVNYPFDNLIPGAPPTTTDPSPAEEVDPRRVPRSVLHCSPVSLSDEKHYVLSSSPLTRSSYVERLGRDIDPDRRSPNLDHTQLLSMPVCPPGSRENSPSVLNAMEDTDLDSLGPPKNHVGQFIVNNSDCPALPGPQSAGMTNYSVTVEGVPQDELVGPLQVSAEPVRIQMEPESFNSGNEHSTGECSASRSTLPETGLQMTELEDALSSVSTSNMSSAEVTEATDSENPSSEDEHDQMSFPAGPLKRHLTARLVASWLCISIMIELHNLANNFQRCPQGSSDSGQAGRTASKRSLMDSPHQSNNNSSGAETGDESDPERDDQSRRPRRKMQKVHDSSTRPPRLLACPFHKMNPIRYSELNGREKEYRRCSSGYWPDISRLK
jgi:hypothetical protein